MTDEPMTNEPITDEPMTDEMPEDRGNVFIGLAICWGCNIIHAIAGWGLILAAGPLGVIVFGGIGLVQLIYVVPLCRHFNSDGQANTVNGLIIAASVTALLNVACWTQLDRVFRP
jgi:hypothetical protein